MTTQIAILKAEATRAMKSRGHRPGRWKLTEFWHTPMRECLDCGMTVHADDHPPANGIDIGGEAVAINCPGSRDAAAAMRRSWRH